MKRDAGNVRFCLLLYWNKHKVTFHHPLIELRWFVVHVDIYRTCYILEPQQSFVQNVFWADKGSRKHWNRSLLDLKMFCTYAVNVNMLSQHFVLPRSMINLGSKFYLTFSTLVITVYFLIWNEFNLKTLTLCMFNIYIFLIWISFNCWCKRTVTSPLSVTAGWHHQYIWLLCYLKPLQYVKCFPLQSFKNKILQQFFFLISCFIESGSSTLLYRLYNIFFLK